MFEAPVESKLILDEEGEFFFENDFCEKNAISFSISKSSAVSSNILSSPFVDVCSIRFFSVESSSIVSAERSAKLS